MKKINKKSVKIGQSLYFSSFFLQNCLLVIFTHASTFDITLLSMNQIVRIRVNSLTLFQGEQTHRENS